VSLQERETRDSDTTQQNRNEMRENGEKRTFLEEFFQLGHQLDSQLTFGSVMFEQGEDVVRECSGLGVASRTKRGGKLALESQTRYRG
jgi:hypothetical protein